MQRPWHWSSTVSDTDRLVSVIFVQVPSTTQTWIAAPAAILFMSGYTYQKFLMPSVLALFGSIIMQLLTMLFVL